MRTVLTTAAIILISLMGNLHGSHAMSADSQPLDIEIAIGDLKLEKGVSSEAIVILNNNTSGQILANIIAVDNSGLFVDDLPPENIAISPNGSYSSRVKIIGVKAGITHLTLLIDYTWADSNNNEVRRKIETIKSDDIEITGFKFDWPNYLIPLALGFILGQLGTWAVEARKNAKEDKTKEEQVLGITLASLHIIQKGLERREPLAIQNWEEMVLKGNLYPYLSKIGKRNKEGNLAKRLTDITVMISVYNKSQKTGELSEDFIIDLTDEINNLTMILEKAEGAKNESDH